MLPKILPPCHTYKNIKHYIHYIRDLAPPGKTGRVAGKILLLFPLEAPIKIHCTLPSFPLSAPIYSTVRSYCFR